MNERRTLVLLAVFSLGFLLTLSGAVLYVRRRSSPPPPIVLRLEVAANGSATLAFTNASPSPQSIVVLGPRTGPEIDVLVDSGEAERLQGPIEVIAPSRTVLLEPGQTLVQDLPLAEYLAVRGRATIHVERARLRLGDLHLKSNSVTIEKGP